VSRFPAAALQTVWTAALIGGLATVCIGRAAGRGDDFIQDYLGAKVLLLGEPPYQDSATVRARFGLPPTGQALTQNPHPPLAVLLALPFAGLPFETAFLAYQVVQVLCVAWAWGVACRTFARGGWTIATLGGLLGGWTPVWQGLDWGQPVGFVAAGAVILWRAARTPAPPARAGLLLALACCLRPFYVALVATAVRWRPRAVMIAGGAAAVTAAALFAVVRLSPIDWLRTGAEVGETYTSQCGSIPGLLGLTGLRGMWAFAAVVTAVGVARWRGVDVDVCAAAALVFGLVAYPLAWFHYDVALIPVLVWVGVTAHGRGLTGPMMLAALYVALRAVPNMQGNEEIQKWLQVGARVLLGIAVLVVARSPGRERMGIEPTGSVVHTPRQF
jgi:hypothetical protein